MIEAKDIPVQWLGEILAADGKRIKYVRRGSKRVRVEHVGTRAYLNIQELSA